MMLQTGHFMQEKSFLAWKLLKSAEIRTAFLAKQKPSKRIGFKGFPMAETVGFEPTCLLGKRFSRPPRYDHFDTSPYIYSILFSSTFARKTCKKCKERNYRKVCKPLCYKGLRWMSRSVIWNISRPPRYDRFDTAPCICSVLILLTLVCNVN